MLYALSALLLAVDEAEIGWESLISPTEEGMVCWSFSGHDSRVVGEGPVGTEATMEATEEGNGRGRS